MIHAQNQKTVILLPPITADNGDFTGNTYADTKGWDQLRVTFIVGTLDAAIGSTAETTAPLLEECDTTDGTYTAITGAALAAVISATDDDTAHAIDVNTQAAKRYIQVQVPHIGDGTTGGLLAIIGQLTRGEQAPNTATEAGLTQWSKATA